MAGHELPNPLEDKRRELRQEAITGLPERHRHDREARCQHRDEGVDHGTPVAADQSGRDAEPAATQDQYVELSREKTDKIFVRAGRFGNERHPSFPDQDQSHIARPGHLRGPAEQRDPGARPSVDNSTVWQPNYDQKHFQDLYFGTATRSKKYYEKQSSRRRYSVDGEVTDWVKVKYNEARYGRSNGSRAPATSATTPGT